MAWEHFRHGADIGVRGLGSTPGEAFAQAAMALTAVVTDPACIRPRHVLEIRMRDSDPELLLFDWLNEIVFLMATRRMLFGHFEVSVDVTKAELHATIHGEPVDRQRHAPAVEIKGVTLTELKVAPLDDGRWLAQCVVDV